MYIEGGFYSGIVKKGITADQEKTINKSQLKHSIFWGLGLVLILYLYTMLNTKQNIPFTVIFCFYLCSIFRVLIYTKEAVFVASGNYIKSETLNFLSTCFIYGVTFLSLICTDISGFYALCIFNLGFVAVYGLSLQIFGNGYTTEDYSELIELVKFSKTNRNSSILFTLSGRVDELSVSFLFMPNNLGIFSKIKEISIMIGTFSSRILSRPWYYIACNIEEKKTYIYHVISILITSIAIILFFPLIENIIKIIIGIMGENWVILFEFSSFIIIIFCSYFLTEFTRCTLVATGGENFVLKLEKISFLFRIAVYSLLLFSSSLDNVVIKVYDVVLIEMFIRIGYLTIQTLYFFLKFFKKLNTNDWKANT